jgi:Uncharacterized conserved protein
LDEKLDKKLARIGEFDVKIDCRWKGRPAIVAMSSNQLALVATGVGQSMSAPFSSARVLDTRGLERDLRFYGMEATVEFRDDVDARLFDETLADAHALVGAEAVGPLRKPPVPLAFVTTLDRIPGWVISRLLGVVTELNATSGFTATTKGNTALDTAMLNLRKSASALGANAILGLTSSTFGAHGGITNALGGDAVGVLLIGTAAVVDAEGTS